MPRLLIHDIDPDAFYLGPDQITRMYYGSTLVYPIGYVLTAIQGSYTLAGQNAILQTANKLAANFGEYVLSGQDVSLQHHRMGTSAQGSYSITGQATSGVKSILFPADPGSYTLTGQDVELTYRTLAADTGAYDLEGFDVNLLYDIMMPAEQGSYGLTGQDAGLSVGTLASTDGGEYTLIGQDASFLHSKLIVAEQGTYALTGQALNLTRQLKLTAAQGSYALSGQAAGVVKAYSMSAAQGSYSVAGQDAMLTPTLMEVLTKLALTTNLKVALDAGDSASLPAASTKWLDTSGNGYDFFRGTSTGSDTTDPTINGTAGRKMSTNYLSFDGGDYLLYDTTNEAWMQTLHKDNAVFTFVMWIYLGSVASSCRLMGTRGGSSTIGVTMSMSATGQLSFTASNGSVNICSADSVATISATTWHMLAVSLTESDAATGLKLFLDNTIETFSGTYASPSASNASFTFQIGANNASNFVPSGTRIAEVAMWDTALSSAQLTAIFEATRKRFNV